MAGPGTPPCSSLPATDHELRQTARVVSLSPTSTTKRVAPQQRGQQQRYMREADASDAEPSHDLFDINGDINNEATFEKQDKQKRESMPSRLVHNVMHPLRWIRRRQGSDLSAPDATPATRTSSNESTTLVTKNFPPMGQRPPSPGFAGRVGDARSEPTDRDRYMASFGPRTDIGNGGDINHISLGIALDKVFGKGTYFIDMPDWHARYFAVYAPRKFELKDIEPHIIRQYF